MDSRDPLPASAGTPGPSFAGPALALAGGVLALVLGTAMGWDATLVDTIVTPPAPVRAALVAGGVVFSLWAFRRGIARISEGRDPDTGGPAALIRGVRFMFLGVAGLSAAAGWLLGHPLPLIVALVIAAVDVLETTFLLLVLGTRRGGGRD
jgi:hypothetical protein